ncbi:aspartate--tRNA ligase, mitochondrial-like isoform X2 [Pomacea canaliculata]|nr:aspartate--tRNA ligase, mitochondrial-like isoform X2 [Pomacea canaliculata]XP_025113254.1 aspartate--tRNA ligase, mitochondrial-like isoform X2 [Pomacea canaliculata]
MLTSLFVNSSLLRNYAGSARLTSGSLRDLKCHHTVGASSYTNRTHLCGELRLKDVGQKITLCGWLQFFRLRQFLILRDWHGTTQLVIPEHKKQELEDVLTNLTVESVLMVNGTVRARPAEQQNEKMATGQIEVEVSDLWLLNPRQLQLPFELKEFHKVKESLRMEYRYLYLRQSLMQNNLRLRSRMVMKMREFLTNKHDFVEVETPTLFRRTPGGAKEFLVPTRDPGKFYTLPQSPQQFKQLLMVGAIDRYFQIARCYRDEGAKPDRQPEFTQVDIEMSFVTQEGIISLIEGLLSSSWPEEKLTFQVPFPRMTYHQAMSLYGTDKPDTRLSWTIKDVKEIFSEEIPPAPVIQGLRIPKGGKYISSKEVDDIVKFSKQGFSANLLATKVKALTSTSKLFSKHLFEKHHKKLVAMLELEEEDILFLSFGNQYEPHMALGKVRLKCADKMEEKGVTLRNKEKMHFLWIQDFPLFLPREDGSEGLESAHHPFTAPHPEDQALLYTCPHKARSQHYDLVLNGQEIGGGSIRIHSAQLQRYVLNNILKEDSTQLEHLLTALDSGCPPHGGIALGLDRLMAIVCQTESIRDVIAFPKSHEGRDLMSGAPTYVSQDELDIYHIFVKK